MANPNPTAAREARKKYAELASTSPTHIQINASVRRTTDEIKRQMKHIGISPISFAEKSDMSYTTFRRHLDVGGLTLWDLLALRRNAGIDIVKLVQAAENALEFEAGSDMSAKKPWLSAGLDDAPVDRGADEDSELQALGELIGLDLQ